MANGFGKTKPVSLMYNQQWVKANSENGEK